MRFTLSNIPMPPSSNAQYAAMAVRGKEGRTFGKIRPTRELENYVKDFGNWALANNVALAKAKKFIRDEILMKGKMLGVDTFTCFPGTSLWTQKGLPKRMDASNRIKALHDCLADSLQVDDSYFWEGSFSKMETSRPQPWVFVEIYPADTISVRDWKQLRELENEAKRQGNGHLG